MRPPTAELAALNITLHPHDAKGQRYVDLLQRAFELDRAIRLQGTTYGMIGSVFPINEGHPEDGMQGDIFRFVQIDMKSEWLDLNTRKAISPKDAQRQVTIPDNLKPNVQRTRYVFFPKGHRLVFASYFRGVSLSPNQALKLFEGLFQHAQLSKSFPNIDVTIEQSAEVLNDILNRMQLRYLRIVVKRPNPDGPDDDDAKLEAVLDDQHANKQVVELHHQKGEFLSPNATNRKLAEIATSNGYVEAVGEDAEGKKEEKNTIKHPLRARFKFAEEEVFQSWFIERARRVVDRITKKK